MSRGKKKMLISLVVVLILFIIAIGAWWYLFFGRANSPLPQTSVSIQSANQSSSPSSSAAAAAISAATTSSAAAASSTIISGENPPLAEEQLNIDSAVFNVEIASTALEQTRGLSFRPSLGANDGMLFIFATGSVQSFWMKDMNFPLDMIWISGNTVVGFAQNVPVPTPGTALWNLPVYASPGNTDKVLEVNVGTVAKYNIKVGDAVTIGAGK
jgi:uncharacterized membrane protein (UPF0127 family)